jgi:hypothetical protein
MATPYDQRDMRQDHGSSSRRCALARSAADIAAANRVRARIEEPDFTTPRLLSMATPTSCQRRRAA